MVSDYIAWLAQQITINGDMPLFMPERDGYKIDMSVLNKQFMLRILTLDEHSELMANIEKEQAELETSKL